VKLSLTAVVVFSTMLSGCLMGPNYKRPIVSAPAAFRGQATAEQPSFADQGWWSVYSDPFLSALIKEALKNNYDLKTAIARAKEADAYRAVARSAYLPTVNEESGVQRRRLPTLVLSRDGFLRRRTERPFGFGFGPHALHRFHHVCVLGQKRVTELRGPIHILSQVGEHIGESGQRLYAGIPWLFFRLIHQLRGLPV